MRKMNKENQLPVKWMLGVILIMAMVFMDPSCITPIWPRIQDQNMPHIIISLNFLGYLFGMEPQCLLFSNFRKK